MSDIPRSGVIEEPVVDGEIEEGDDAAEVDETGETEGDDAGRDDGEGEEEGPEAEDDVDAPPAPRRGGGSQTIREQRRRAQEAERRAVALERENAELRGFNAGAASRQPQMDPQAAARAEAEFYAQLEQMPPAQAYQAIVNRERQNFSGAFQQLQFNQQDLADRTEFAASCAASPTRAAYRERVEQYRADQRRAGFVIGREEAFHLLYGRDLEARANKARPGQQRAGQRNIQRQQTRPTGARSTATPQGRRPQPGSLEADEALINAAIARGEQVF